MDARSVRTAATLFSLTTGPSSAPVRSALRLISHPEFEGYVGRASATGKRIVVNIAITLLQNPSMMQSRLCPAGGLICESFHAICPELAHQSVKTLPSLVKTNLCRSGH